MAVVYIKEQGACIKKHSNRLIIEKDGELLAELRLIRVTGISVIGNVQITTQALHTILQAGVDVSFFSGSGLIFKPYGTGAFQKYFLET